MEIELKKVKEETEKNCHDTLNSKMMRMVEEKDNEMRFLKSQMAKQKQTDNERSGHAGGSQKRNRVSKSVL